MNKLWDYEDYVHHLAHENGIVRRWAFSALENRFMNKYEEKAADLIYDENEHLVCAVLRYLAFHRAVQHAPAILDRFESGRGIIASNCAVTLAKMHYEPAEEIMLKSMRMPEDDEAIFGILDYLGNVRTERCRAVLKTAVMQTRDTLMSGSAIVNLLNHNNPEDIDLSIETLFNSGGGYDRHDMRLRNLLSAWGGASYFRDLTGFGTNDILSKPSETVGKLIFRNAHLPTDEPIRENLIPLLENRRYQDFAMATRIAAGNMIDARYPADDIPEYLRESFEQDAMCLHFLDKLSETGTIWQNVESSEAFGSDLISLIVSAFFAVHERSAYVKALSPDADVGGLIQALKDSGPSLPVPIQDKIRAVCPITELKTALSKDLSTWGDTWTVRLMGMIGSKEFVPDLIHVLRNADALDYIYSDAQSSIVTLDDSADESVLAVIRNGELDDWASFAILEHLPYAEAYDLALKRWENPDQDGMDSFEFFSSCLRGIGDRRAIKVLQNIYAEENDADYIGDSLECLSKIHRVDISEMPDIVKNRKERAEIQKARANRLSKLFKDSNVKTEQNMLENKRNVVPIKGKAAKIGRNAPCPCGSGKKYKKCCLNKK